MSRKAPAEKGKKPAKKAKAPKKPVTAYFAVREMVSVNRSYTEPDRMFTSRTEAQKYADKLNRELRQFTNPFDDDHDVQWLLTDGEDALFALVKKFRLPAPQKYKGYSSVDWERWWDAHYFDMSDAQRDAIWDALDQFNWYKVKTTELEG
jgi:hypothetical protein